MGGIVARGNVFGGRSKVPRLKKGGECRFLAFTYNSHGDSRGDNGDSRGEDGNGGVHPNAYY
jgi:hypothetical protein